MEKINARKQLAKQSNSSVYSQYELVNSATNDVNSLIDVSKLNKSSKQQLKASLKSIKKKNKALLTKKVKQSMNKLIKEKKKLKKIAQEPATTNPAATDFFLENSDLLNAASINGLGNANRLNQIMTKNLSSTMSN